MRFQGMTFGSRPGLREFRTQRLSAHAPALAILGVALYTVGTQFVLGLPVLTSLILPFVLGLVLLILVRPSVGYFALVATFSAETLQIADLFTAVKLLGALVGFAWAIDLVFRRRSPLPRSSVFVWTLVYLAWACVTLIVARDLDAGVERLGTLLQLVLLTFITGTLLQRQEDVTKAAWILLLSTTLSSLYGASRVMSGELSELEGLAGDRNTSSVFIAMSLPFLFCFLKQAGRLRRALLLGVFAILAACIALSFSRTGFLATGLSAALSLVLVVRKNTWRRGLIAIAVLLAVISLAPDTYWDRMFHIAEAIEHGSDTVGLRYQLWHVSMRMIQDHPIFGVGVGNYFARFMQYGGIIGLRRAPLGAHNSYLGVSAELGLVGGGIFVGILVLTLLANIRSFRRARAAGEVQLADLAGAFTICVVVLGLSSFSLGMQTLKYLWMLVGAAPALAAIVRNRVESRADRLVPPAPAQP